MEPVVSFAAVPVTILSAPDARDEDAPVSKLTAPDAAAEAPEATFTTPLVAPLSGTVPVDMISDPLILHSTRDVKA